MSHTRPDFSAAPRVCNEERDAAAFAWRLNAVPAPLGSFTPTVVNEDSGGGARYAEGAGRAAGQ